MKTIAVIAEFNPFHNGHAWFLAEARRRAQADALVVIMSGDYVQRGEPAVFDKFTRAETALLCGADLVLELPVSCAAAGAGYFAQGAVRLLDALGCADELWFGSECGDIQPFEETAALLADESPTYAAALQDSLSGGLSFPAARAAALSLTTGRDPGDLLSAPNNILGLEYCVALARAKSSIRPRTIGRRGSGYHDTFLTEGLSSATAIRKLLLYLRENGSQTGPAGIKDLLRGQMPDACLPAVIRALESSLPVCADDFSEMLHYQLLRETAESLTGYLDLSEDLAARIIRLLPKYRSFTQFAALLKSRNATRTQINRALLHALLGIRQADPALAMSLPFARLLGFRSEAAALLTGIKKAGGLTLAAGAADLADAPGYTRDLFASNLYEARRAAITGEAFIHEFSRSVIRL